MDKSIMDILRGIIKEAEEHKNWPNLKDLLDFGSSFTFMIEEWMGKDFFTEIRSMISKGLFIHVADLIIRNGTTYDVNSIKDDGPKNIVGSEHFTLIQLWPGTSIPILCSHCYETDGVTILMYHQSIPIYMCEKVYDDGTMHVVVDKLNLDVGLGAKYMSSMYLKNREPI
jgi:hypothetical protein